MKSIWIAVFFLVCAGSASGMLVTIGAGGTIGPVDAESFYSNTNYRLTVLRDALYWPTPVQDAPGEPFRVQCTQTPDVQYVPSTGGYIISEWMLSTSHFGASGSQMVIVDVFDLATFASAAWDAGVWTEPASCADLWGRIQTDFVMDLVAVVATDDTFQDMRAMQQGLDVQVLCLLPAAPVYIPCTSSLFASIRGIVVPPQ